MCVCVRARARVWVCVSWALQEVPGGVCNYRKGDVSRMLDVFSASPPKFVSSVEASLKRITAIIILRAMSTELVRPVSSQIWVSQTIVKF